MAAQVPWCIIRLTNLFPSQWKEVYKGKVKILPDTEEEQEEMTDTAETTTEETVTE